MKSLLCFGEVLIDFLSTECSDAGTLFDKKNRHLVGSTRMVFNYCKAYALFGAEHYKTGAIHGLNYVAARHWDENRRGYHWTLREHEPVDQTNHCYGLAFVLLMYSAALSAKVINNSSVLISMDFCKNSVSV